jgi:hypothetical protein
MREARKIKLGDDLCSYEQDDGGDFCGSEAWESLSDQPELPVHQFALDDLEPLSVPFSQPNSPEHLTTRNEDDELTPSISAISPEDEDSDSEAPDIRNDPSNQAPNNHVKWDLSGAPNVPRSP